MIRRRPITFIETQMMQTITEKELQIFTLTNMLTCQLKIQRCRN